MRTSGYIEVLDETSNNSEITFTVTSTHSWDNITSASWGYIAANTPVDKGKSGWYTVKNESTIAVSGNPDVVQIKCSKYSIQPILEENRKRSRRREAFSKQRKR